MSEHPILEIDAVSVVRDGRRLLDRVTITVARGTTHVLLGPNGAGKTTLLGAVLGQLPFSGGIRFHWRGGGRLGYVPQAFHVDRTLPLTVGEFLALGRQRRPVCFGVRRVLRQHLQEVLDRVGLADCWARPLGVLSGGELRRVLLANAIDPTPEFLLLDEPASGLDEAATRQFEATIAALTRDAGASVLMVSHDFGQVQRLADCVTLIDQCVRRSGPPADVIGGDLAALFALGTRPSLP
ncbi:MAG: metal ABC transporter ATP-binding protein [Deltaproteobacteria bacterium]|nr:metal ABC transporter ATP-binding protein [Deltaproteobacteria bacterium]